jgi:hypothetical protein
LVGWVWDGLGWQPIPDRSRLQYGVPNATSRDQNMELPICLDTTRHVFMVANVISVCA